MFYTGLDPYTLKPVYVPRTPAEKAEQRALLQYFRPENHALVRRALQKIGRTDLIGTGPDCLVPPDRSQPRAGQARTAAGGKKPPEKSRRRPLRQVHKKKSPQK